jgi:outer membrane receptor for ferrienterochelin and colicins
MRVPLAAMLVLGLLLGTAPARADEASEAALQFELGSELYRQGRFEEALQRFIASNRLVPNANVVFNVAQTYRYLRRWRDAYNWFETYLVEFELDDRRRARGIAARDGLQRRVAVVEIRVTPPEATLYVTRRDLGAVGRGPRRLAVEAGTVRVLAAAEGYADAEATTTAVRGRVTPVTLTLERLRGVLRVRSEVEDAEVTLADGTALGPLPFEGRLDAGRYTVIVSAPQHLPETREVTLEPGATATLQVPLRVDPAQTAILTVDGTPDGARVRLDERELGIVPLSRSGLPPGQARLRVEAPGLEAVERSIALEAGSRTRAAVDLAVPYAESPRRRLRRGLYPAYGGVFAAGIAFGVAAFVTRGNLVDAPNPDRATLDALRRLNLTADVLLISSVGLTAITVFLDLLIQVPRSRMTVRVEN